MEYGLGRAAAASLGFIHGNLPGARKADKAFKMFYKYKHGGVKEKKEKKYVKKRDVVKATYPKKTKWHQSLVVNRRRRQKPRPRKVTRKLKLLRKVKNPRRKRRGGW